MIYITSQVFAAASLLISIYRNFVKTDRKVMLISQIVINILYGMHNIFLGAITGGAINLIAVVLLIAYYYKKKVKWLSTKLTPAFFCLLFCATALLSWQNFYSILPLLASFVFALAFWQDEEKQIKVLFILNTLLWLVYAVITKSVVGVVGQTLLSLSLIVYLIFGAKYEKAVDKFNLWLKTKFAKNKK